MKKLSEEKFVFLIKHIYIFLKLVVDIVIIYKFYLFLINGSVKMIENYDVTEIVHDYRFTLQSAAVLIFLTQAMRFLIWCMFNSTFYNFVFIEQIKKSIILIPVFALLLTLLQFQVIYFNEFLIFSLIVVSITSIFKIIDKFIENYEYEKFQYDYILNEKIRDSKA